MKEDLDGFIVHAYELLRCLDLQIRQFLCRQQQQMYINVSLLCMHTWDNYYIMTYILYLITTLDLCLALELLKDLVFEMYYVDGY